MFARGKFAKPIALLCLGTLSACSGGSADPPPAAGEVAAARVTASVLSPATTTDKCALTSPCISGTNTSTGPGVFGLSAHGNGVSGSSSSAFGVYGKSTSSYGVYGTSGYAGVAGVGNTYGVFGDNQTSNGTGVYGANSGGGDALQGYAPGNGTGAQVEGYFALYARSLSTSGYIILGESSGGSTVFSVDNAGNMALHGSLLKFLPATGGASATAYGPSATRPSVEDTGTARLIVGQATVRLDPTFARTIDASRPYQVFLTPGGDTRGLYVAGKSASSFVVREVQGGRGTFDFDYHIYATALGSAGAHMSIAAPQAAMRPNGQKP